MATFQLRPHGFAKLRKTTLARIVPLTVLILGGGIGLFWLASRQNEDLAARHDHTNPYVFILPLMAIIGVFSIRSTLRRQRTFYESFLLTIEDDAVVRSMTGHPLIRISREEIRAIERTPNAFVIKGKEQLSHIHIPLHIEDPERVESLLARLAPIEHVPTKKRWRLLLLPLMLVVLLSMAGIVGASAKWLIALSASIFFPMMIVSLVFLFRSKNVEYRTKSIGVVPSMVLLAMAAITVFRLNTPSPIDALLAYTSRLAPGITATQLEKASCSDRIVLPSDRRPHIVWTSTDDGSCDGALIDVINIGRTAPLGRITYFHWEADHQLIVLLPLEDTAMVPGPLEWSTLLDDATSVRLFGSDHRPLAQVDFGAWHDEDSGTEMDAVTYYRYWDNELYEYSEPLRTSVPHGHPCLMEDPASLDDWLSGIAIRRGSIGPMEFSPSEIAQDPIIQQFMNTTH